MNEGETEHLLLAIQSLLRANAEIAALRLMVGALLADAPDALERLKHLHPHIQAMPVFAAYTMEQRGLIAQEIGEAVVRVDTTAHG